MFLHFSNPGHPFAAGLTLEKLAAVTVDENGKETFVTGGSLDRIQKVRLSGFYSRIAIRAAFAFLVLRIVSCLTCGGPSLWFNSSNSGSNPESNSEEPAGIRDFIAQAP